MTERQSLAGDDAKGSTPDPKGQAPGAGEQDEDLDSLLSEGREGLKDKPQPRETTDKAGGSGVETEIASLRETVSQLVNREAQAEIKSGLDQAVQTIADHSEALGNLHEMDPDWIESHLRLKAANTPGLEQAFAERTQNPGRWNKILGAVAKELDERAQKIAAPKSPDRHAAAAASRGTSAPPETWAQTPPQEELNKMSLGQLMDSLKGA